MEEHGNIFRRSNKVLRSPEPGNTPKQPEQSASKADTNGDSSPNTTEVVDLTYPNTEEDTTNSRKEQNTSPAAQPTSLRPNSPRQEFITKMRLAEEESLEKCKSIVQKMKQAIAKQKNVSLDVKNGAAQLEEMLDIIISYRRNWQTSEKESVCAAQANRKDITDKVPGPATPKRRATSPPEQQPSQKTRRKKDGQWQLVTHKKQRMGKPDEEENAAGTPKSLVKAPQRKKENEKRRGLKSKKLSEAVVIKPAEGSSYADVLKNIRSKLKLSDEVNLKGIRKTRAGAVLLELEKGQTADPNFCEALRTTLRETATVADLKPKATVEIKDLDSLTTKEEVTDSVKRALQGYDGDLKINISAPNSREQVRAYVTINEEQAEILIKQARIKIGWINCRVRLRENYKRCFRCFGPGHSTWDCQGPDRRGQGLCIKCGQPGHKMKECNKPPKCCLCSEAKYNELDHIPSSMKCSVYRNWSKK